MRIAILGLGVIGTTYAYALQKAGHDTFHIVREGKQHGLRLPLFYGNMERVFAAV
jgi:ketopantoate reductase